MSLSKVYAKVYFEISKTKKKQPEPVKMTPETFIDQYSLANDDPKLFTHISDLIKSQSCVESYVAIQENAMPIRGNIIDWLLAVTDRMIITHETFFRTTLLFDTYLSKLQSPVTDPNRLHFIAVICFFISYKFDETGVMSLAFVEEKLLRNKYTKKEIISQETNILITLNFKLNFPTVNTFSKIFIQAVNTNLQRLEVSDENFIKKLDCIYNFVNKISLFVDEFIFGTKCSNVAAINFNTTMVLMKNLKLINDENYKNVMAFVMKIIKNFEDTKKVEVYSSGLFLAIMNQEKQGCHQNLFATHYTNVSKLIQKEAINSF